MPSLLLQPNLLPCFLSLKILLFKTTELGKLYLSISCNERNYKALWDQNFDPGTLCRAGLHETRSELKQSEFTSRLNFTSA